MSFQTRKTFVHVRETQMKVFFMNSESFLTLPETAKQLTRFKTQKGNPDYFNNVFTTFLGLERVSCFAVSGRVRKLSEFIKIS